ncbi:MAG: transcriptional repressor [Anaerolineae bacterium]|nr:transcriptional repressor [Anaerolineae bacterium]
MWDYRRAASQPLARAMAERGLRLTRPRLAIVQVLSQCARHLSANEIWQAARELYEPLGRATAFRTLNQMVKLGLVRPLYLKSGEQRYMVVAGGHHHHMVCIRCGTTIELPDCPLPDTVERAAEEAGFQITGHVVEFFGLCRDCQRKLED